MKLRKLDRCCRNSFYISGEAGEQFARYSTKFISLLHAKDASVATGNPSICERITGGSLAEVNLVQCVLRMMDFCDDVEVPILARFADYLSPRACAIDIEDDGLLPGILTGPGEDDTLFIAYLPCSMVESLADCPTVQYSKL